MQRPGEIIVVPTAWWHATCNLSPYTFSLGGQDGCDLHGVPPHWTADPARHETCHGPMGREWAERAWASYVAPSGLRETTRVNASAAPPRLPLAASATPLPAVAEDAIPTVRSTLVEVAATTGQPMQLGTADGGHPDEPHGTVDALG